MNELTLALRNLRRTPALTAIAIVSLALGIGANVTVFSVVREMVLDDVSAQRPDRLTLVQGVDASYSQFRDLRAAGVFEDLAYHRGLGDRVWHSGSHNEIAWAVPTSANFFNVLGVHAALGRLYGQSDEGRKLAVVSHGFWRRRLGADPRAPGQALQLNGRLYTLAGVLPRDYLSVYGHGVSPEVYVLDAGSADPRDRVYAMIGRLRDGATREQSRQALAAVVERRGDPASRPVALAPLGGPAATIAKGGDEWRFFLFFAMLSGVAGLLALIACSNVAGLLVARALHRRREMGIRQALGAGRLQLIRPLLAEGTVLVVCGTLCGLALDTLLRERLREVRWPSAYGIPFEFHFQGDSGLVLYASCAALVALVLSSLLPALRGSRADLRVVMKQGEPAFSTRGWTLRSGFVTMQVVLSVVLLIVSGLFTRSLWHLAANGPGFDIAHTLIAAVHLQPGGSFQREQALRRIRAVPGVLSVTSAGTLPLMGEMPEGEVRRAGGSPGLRAYVLEAGETFCATLEIPLLRGRDFERADQHRTPVPLILNRTLAARLFGDSDPVGQSLVLGREREEHLQVVGVAADSRLRTLGEGDVPALYRPAFNGQFLLRVAGNPAQWTEPLRDALGETDRAAALDIRPLRDAAAGALFPMQVAVGFVGSLSVLGISLALVGLYGSISSAVGRRSREFGIRSALGAPRRRIVAAALRDGIAVLAWGTLAGVPLALAVIRLLADLLPAGVDPWAPGPFLGTVALLFVTGAAAAWIPAHRAAQVDPTVALRQE